MNRRNPHASRSRGFTLIEILVAVTILIILAVAAYGGLNALIKAREITQEHDRHFQQLQLAMATITRDLRQASTRPVRLTSGVLVPAMMGGANNIPALAFTRAGRPNPLLLSRSGLQRVGYTVEDGKLERISFDVLDRAIAPTPQRQTLLDGVQAISLAFMDAQHQSRTHWPPLNSEPGTFLSRNPIAVKITLDTKRWGEINRLVLLAQ
ncbi:MAG: type II secretion system minor pseudopilin GspJ [Gammaproteobacteria bacterium]|nr:type II secretion system minor pseudopilin GspJ [Gammaproteobacteria bacterium]